MRQRRGVVAALLALGSLAACSSGSDTNNSSAPTPSAARATPSVTARPSPSPSPTPTSADVEWPTYHRTNFRDGYSATTGRPKKLSDLWRKQLDAAVYAEPLVVGNRVIVATENNTVYAFAAKNGHQLWKRHLATPVPLSTLPCGNIDPLGITGTPAYDDATQRVFFVVERVGVHHDLYGLDIRTGKTEVRRSADPPNQDPRPMQQRGAMLVAYDRVYITYGGLAGDCGDYHGHVVGLQTDGNGRMLFWRVPTPREGGIWAPPGPSLAPNGHLLVAVGNGESQTTYDGSDSVVELTPTLKRVSFFAASTWRDDNAHDLDLGSMGPAVLPDGHVFVAGKRGVGYLMKQGSLGGIGGEIASHEVCAPFGGAARTGQRLFLPCDDGLRRITVKGNDFSVDWHARSNITGAPVLSRDAVWSLDPPAGLLYVLDLGSGDVITSRPVGTTTRFATPTLSGNRVFVGTQSGIVALLAR